MLDRDHYRILWLRVLALFFVATVGTSALYAQDWQIKNRPTLPGEDCRTDPLKSWTPQEKWVWIQACQGKTADFNMAEGYGGILDSKKDKEWPENRRLTPTFLETILLHEPYRGVLTRHGVQIVGAWFREPLDLSNSTLTNELALISCRFESVVNFNRLKTSETIFLNNSVFNGKLFIENLQTASGLIMMDGKFAEVDLGGAKIGGQLSMIGSTFSEKLDMNGSEVQRGLFMRDGAKFAEVDLHSAKIGSQLDMSNSAFSGKLEMDSLHVQQHLLMDNRANFSEVDLHNAKIGGTLSMIGSTFSEKLDMNCLEVKQDLVMKDGAKFTEVNLNSAKIGGQIDMTGSNFSGKLGMNDIGVERNLLMRNRSKFSEVDLRNARIGGQINMTASTLSGKLDMNGLQVRQHLFMHGMARFAEVDLNSANIGGQLSMIGSTFSGKLHMNSLQVQQHLFMRDGAKFAEVDLRSAKIGDTLDMTGSVFSDKLDMDALHVERSLFMSNGASFAEVYLSGAKIGDTLDMSGSAFSGKVDMEALQVGRSLLMDHGAKFKEPLNLEFGKIGLNLNLSDSTFASIVLTAAHVGSTFVLGPPATHWLKEAKLTLRNAEVGVLKDSPDAWPDNLELDGFVYGRFEGLSADAKGAVPIRDICWLQKWLAKQKRYSPQPYEQLASIFQKQGQEDKAEKVLYWSKNSELGETTSIFRRLYLTFLKYFIGYKYRIYYTIPWVIGFALLGMGFLWLSGQRRAHRIGFWYSLDMLLPVIRLRDKHYQIDLDGLVRYYFYIHKMVGYVLAYFLIAGLSGLIK